MAFLWPSWPGRAGEAGNVTGHIALFSHVPGGVCYTFISGCLILTCLGHFLVC